MERREFFKLAGFSAAAATFAAALPACSSLPIENVIPDNEAEGGSFVSAGIPIDFYAEADVLIIGSGLAGFSAAIDPSEAGYSVIMAERLDLMGGESYNANGLFYTAGTKIQKEAGIKTSIDDAWAQTRENLTERGLTVALDFEETLFRTGSEWVDRIVADYGAEFANPREYLEKGSPDTFLIPKVGLSDMASVMGPLREKLTAQGVTYELGMRAFLFILDENFKPVGMRFLLDEDNLVRDIKAKKIVLATGGFICNQPMVQEYLPAQTNLPNYTTYADGDGNRLAPTIKGQLKGMEEPGPLTSDLPHVEVWGLFGPVVNVSPQGTRIAAEDKPGSSPRACFTNELGYWWTIFDSQISENGRSRSTSYVQAQAPKRMQGPFDTIEGMAEGLGINAEILKGTFEAYEASVDAGEDTEFGKTVFLEKLSPPYYAIKQFPFRFRTFGGIATNEDAQMIDGMGSPISNVYAVGACASGSYMGLTSHGAYGTIAGRAIVAALNEQAAEEAAETDTDDASTEAEAAETNTDDVNENAGEASEGETETNAEATEEPNAESADEPTGT